MASLTRPPASLPGAAASDLFGSSSGGGGDRGLSLRALGRARLGGGAVGTRRGGGGGAAAGAVVAKLRKVKKHEYPWPDDPDPNVKGGVLSHLSPFKPLKEKPKPVTLEFEKPLVELEKKIMDVRKMANETGLDFSDQIALLESKYQQEPVLHAGIERWSPDGSGWTHETGTAGCACVAQEHAGRKKK